MIISVIKDLKSVHIERCKRYTQAIGLKKSEWVKVFIDYAISNICYKFSALDYYVIGNGYTLSRYEKKRFFTEKRASWLWNKVNNPKYIHFVENKVDALAFFKDFVSRKWLYASKSSFSDFYGFCEQNTGIYSKALGTIIVI